MQPEIAVQRDIARYQMESQSPYGAKWFATRHIVSVILGVFKASRNPLTGLSGLQRLQVRPQVPRFSDVAIPLRG